MTSCFFSFRFVVLLIIPLGTTASPIGGLPEWFGGRHRVYAAPAQVPRRSWLDVHVPGGAGKDDGDRARARALAAARSPMLLTKSPSTKWAASTWLTPRDAANCSGDVLFSVLDGKVGLHKLRVRKLRGNLGAPVFVYEDRSRLLADGTGRYVDTTPAHKKVTIRTHRFLGTDATRYYYSHALPEEDKSIGTGSAEIDPRTVVDIDPRTGDPRTGLPVALDTSPKSSSEQLETRTKKIKKKKKKTRTKKQTTADRMHDKAMKRIGEACTPRAIFDVSVRRPTATTISHQQKAADASSGSYLWMGAPNVTASAHYDRSHNFFAQLVGHKRFYIWAPAQLPNLYISPFYHARDRQSQLVQAEWGEEDSFLEDLNEKFPRAFDTEGGVPRFTVDLAPGDLLYLPPYWAHRVTSLGPGFSLSVNMWSPGEEQVVGDALNEAGLPKVITETLTPESSHSQKQLGVDASALFLRLVIARTLYMFPSRSGDESENEKVENIPVLPDPLPLLQTLYKTRYAPEHKRYACGGRGREADMAFNPSRCPRFVTLKDTDMADIERVAERVARRFAILQELPRDHGRAVAEVLLKDYAERLVTFAVGVERACMFLQCVGTPSAFARG